MIQVVSCCFIATAKTVRTHHLCRDAPWRVSSTIEATHLIRIGMTSKGQAKPPMPKTKILQEGQSYTFRSYFQMPYEAEDILAEFHELSC
ncbi:hypothetical protein [Coleofasciculus chthonoplastes]|uniref:hypothetical protein n=1 Tax=Coleofasciculus chthonoplastes TaxID=64178 RepID=UPI0012FC7014|nr:hypothetical protein [Coleofasciculus chthonoplastes]